MSQKLVKTNAKSPNPKRSEGPPTDAERFAIVRLIRSPGIGPVRFFQLYHHYGSALEAVHHFKEATQNIKSAALCAPQDIEKELTHHQKIGIHLLTFLDPTYPSLLQEIKDMPPVLSVLGNASILQKPLLGVVGSRNASINSRDFMKRLIGDLIKQDIYIVSGFARGMDTAAHEASLTCGTVGVLAGGVDVIYPEENGILYKKIQETGCLISETPLGLQPQGQHFPRRNRLISGVARGVLLSEARFQSGSMITAEYALEQGRDVFAIPGSPLDPRCAGSNHLLKQGAIFVTRAEDILDVFGNTLSSEPLPSCPVAQLPDRDEATLLSLLSQEPLPRDIVLEHFGGSVESFNRLCTQLELEGKIMTYFGGLLSLGKNSQAG